jgi:hypothetical protein
MLQVSERSIWMTAIFVGIGSLLFWIGKKQA